MLAFQQCLTLCEGLVHHGQLRPKVIEFLTKKLSGTTLGFCLEDGCLINAYLLTQYLTSR